MRKRGTASVPMTTGRQSCLTVKSRWVTPASSSSGSGVWVWWCTLGWAAAAALLMNCIPKQRHTCAAAAAFQARWQQAW